MIQIPCYNKVSYLQLNVRSKPVRLHINQSRSCKLSRNHTVVTKPSVVIHYGSAVEFKLDEF
jgi:hypothetical protein